MLTINKNDYIERFNKHKSLIIPESKKDYNMDSDFIYYYNIDRFYKYPINDILFLNSFYNEFRTYIYLLKKDSIIYNDSFGKLEKSKIIKINHYRIKKDKIKSFSIIEYIRRDNGTILEYKKNIPITSISYKNVLFSDLLDVIKTFNSFYFFSDFDINKANEILAKIQPIAI